MEVTTKSRMSAALAGTALLGAAVAIAAPATPAEARATDAVNGCGAYNVGKDTATVPASTQGSTIFHANTKKGNFPIKCGNGTTWGAVHIEVKHNVPNWADALSCIDKAINRTKGIFDPTNGKTRYTYSFSGKTVIVVRGKNGILTAYPTRTNVAAKWEACSVS